ncbi:hypothetical protein BDY21DRAFT_364491 [Lineolata rhizophorae]|uniref:Uncharacterized protein n=1 Tax=Lineolata rhizophorae TaxID=578093 RepID=A0A6A6NZ56_9PEZI|nr:hypothetical protein BDY21DRAFT_364491 [Lineolata rhizophorae]
MRFSGSLAIIALASRAAAAPLPASANANNAAHNNVANLGLCLSQANILPFAATPMEMVARDTMSRVKRDDSASAGRQIAKRGGLTEETLEMLENELSELGDKDGVSRKDRERARKNREKLLKKIEKIEKKRKKAQARARKHRLKNTPTFDKPLKGWDHNKEKKAMDNWYETHPHAFDGMEPNPPFMLGPLRRLSGNSSTPDEVFPDLSKFYKHPVSQPSKEATSEHPSDKFKEYSPVQMSGPKEHLPAQMSGFEGSSPPQTSDSKKHSPFKFSDSWISYGDGVWTLDETTTIRGDDDIAKTRTLESRSMSEADKDDDTEDDWDSDDDDDGDDDDGEPDLQITYDIVHDAGKIKTESEVTWEYYWDHDNGTAAEEPKDNDHWPSKSKRTVEDAEDSDDDDDDSDDDEEDKPDYTITYKVVHNGGPIKKETEVSYEYYFNDDDKTAIVKDAVDNPSPSKLGHDFLGEPAHLGGCSKAHNATTECQPPEFNMSHADVLRWLGEHGYKSADQEPRTVPHGSFGPGPFKGHHEGDKTIKKTIPVNLEFLVVKGPGNDNVFGIVPVSGHK